MFWIAPSERDTDHAALEKRLWDAADQFRADAGFKSQEYSAPVHGLEGDIRHGGNVNSYYDDPHDATGRFDFVLASSPFNVNAVDKERLKDMVGANCRFPFGLPRTDNAIKLPLLVKQFKTRVGVVPFMEANFDPACR